MFPVARKLFRISKDSTAIVAGAFNILDPHLILGFILALGKEDTLRLRGFTGTRFNSLFARAGSWSRGTGSRRGSARCRSCNTAGFRIRRDCRTGCRRHSSTGFRIWRYTGARFRCRRDRGTGCWKRICSRTTSIGQTGCQTRFVATRLLIGFATLLNRFARSRLCRTRRFWRNNFASAGWKARCIIVYRGSDGVITAIQEDQRTGQYHRF